MPRMCPLPIVRSLNENGIYRLVVGHTPHGNCPTVIKNRCGEHGEYCLEVRPHLAVRGRRARRLGAWVHVHARAFHKRAIRMHE